MRGYSTVSNPYGFDAVKYPRIIRKPFRLFGEGFGHTFNECPFYCSFLWLPWGYVIVINGWPYGLAARTTEHTRGRPAVILCNAPMGKESPIYRQCDQLHPEGENEVWQVKQDPKPDSYCCKCEVWVWQSHKQKHWQSNHIHVFLNFHKYWNFRPAGTWWILMSTNMGW